MKPADYIKTFIFVAIVLFFTLQKGGGMWIAFLLLFFFVTAAYHLIRMVRKPEERKVRAIRLAIWFATLTLSIAVQAYWDAAARNAADDAAKAVVAYKASTGMYPANLAESGLNGPALENEWSLRLFIQDGKPVLVYPMTFMPLSTYVYDFEGNKWRANSD